MTPDALATIHRAAFTTDRPWSATEFSNLLDNRFTELITDPNGFAVTRTIAGETELLTLAVDPAFQRQGIARRLLSNWLNRATARAFLEVAADNAPAIALYNELGFCVISTRKAYYMRKNTKPADAIVMQRN